MQCQGLRREVQIRSSARLGGAVLKCSQCGAQDVSVLHDPKTEEWLGQNVKMSDEEQNTIGICIWCCPSIRKNIEEMDRKTASYYNSTSAGTFVRSGFAMDAKCAADHDRMMCEK
jgi:hypothetical protein